MTLRLIAALLATSTGCDCGDSHVRDGGEDAGRGSDAGRISDAVGAYVSGWHSFVSYAFPAAL